jgi:hypothetical protein
MLIAMVATGGRLFSGVGSVCMFAISHKVNTQHDPVNGYFVRCRDSRTR